MQSRKRKSSSSSEGEVDMPIIGKVITNNYTDWDEFKHEKKELREKRRKTKVLYEASTIAKQIGEKLRMKGIEENERTSHTSSLHILMVKNGGFLKFVMAHDTSRVVQNMIKFGMAPLKRNIAAEVIPKVVEVLQSKYAKYCVKRLLKYGAPETRSQLIRAMYGNAVKLASHAESAAIFEYAYSSWASPKDKYALIQEFFGSRFWKSKDFEVLHLRDAYKDCPEMKAATLFATKANLLKIVNKEMLDSGLVQSVLYQFLTECTAEDRAELITLVAPHIVVISNSKDGVRAAMQCIWHGTNKDRKIAMKAIKENIIELCEHEYGHSMIITLFDAIDDTVLLNKIILEEILKKPTELLNCVWGRKVLIWLVRPADTARFHPLFINELEAGRKDSSCKKEVDVRRKEVLAYCSSPLLKAIAADPKNWIDRASKSYVTMSVLTSGSGEDLQNALKAISEAIVDTEWMLARKGVKMLPIEHPGIHMTLKKLAQYDSQRTDQDTFGGALVDVLTDSVIKSWAKLNRGCFLLVSIYENNDEEVQTKLKDLLVNHVGLLKRQSHVGASILCKKINSE